MTNRQVELVVRRAGNPEQRLFLAHGVMHLGRAEDNDLVLPDIGVSRRHARIIVSDAQVRYEDLGSGNGSFVRGRRVDRHVVSNGDEIVIDPFQLVFRVHGERDEALEDDETVRGPDAEELEAAPARLVVLAGHRLAAAYPVGATPLSLGRSEVRDVVLFDPAASRDHSAIEMRGDGFWLVDRGSANGTYVNELRVSGNQRLSSGDRVRIGSTEFRFEVVAASPVPAAPVAPPPVAAPPPAAPIAPPVAPAAPPPVVMQAPPMAPVSAPPVAAPPMAPAPLPAPPPMVAAQVPAPPMAVPAPSPVAPTVAMSAPGPARNRNTLAIVVGIVGFFVVLLGAAVLVGGFLFWKHGGLPTNAPEPPGVGAVYTPAEGSEAEVARLMAQGAMQAGIGRHLDAARKYYQVQKVDEGNPEASRRGYLACEMVVFDILSDDLASRDADPKALKGEIKAALSLGRDALDGKSSLADAYDAVDALSTRLPDNEDLASMARALYAKMTEFGSSDEGQAMQEKVGKSVVAGFDALQQGDLDGAAAAFEKALKADPERKTPQAYRAQEGLQVVGVARAG